MKCRHPRELVLWPSNQGPQDRLLTIGDYEAGDIVFDKSYIIYTATRNENEKGGFQLASYMEFSGEGKELDRSWMNVWKMKIGCEMSRTWTQKSAGSTAKASVTSFRFSSPSRWSLYSEDC